jgi:hypothetical protein
MAKKSETKKKQKKQSKHYKPNKQAYTLVKHNADKYPMVRVIWADAYSMPHGWRGLQEAKTLATGDQNLVADVGYLVEKTDNHIVLAARVSQDGDVGGLMKIPVTWAKITYLK